MLILASRAVVSMSAAEEFDAVTCGSVIKLTHKQSGFKLHSHEIPYGTGSRQQSVTAFPASDDPNSYWTVRSAYGQTCRYGEPVKCGSSVRLQHLNTKKNLHSHQHESPLSHNQEVSAYGDENSGDTGDNWRVECGSGSSTWPRGEPVYLFHVDTGKYLYSHTQYRYGHPIAGQQEVAANARKTAAEWQADEGIFFAPRGSSNSKR